MTSLNLFITQSPAHKTVGHVVSGQKYLLKKIIFTCPLLYCRMTSNFSEPFQDASKIYLFTNISELKVRKHTQRGKKKNPDPHFINQTKDTFQLSYCPSLQPHHLPLVITLFLHYTLYWYKTAYFSTDKLFLAQLFTSSRMHFPTPSSSYPFRVSYLTRSPILTARLGSYFGLE